MTNRFIWGGITLAFSVIFLTLVFFEESESSPSSEALVAVGQSSESFLEGTNRVNTDFQRQLGLLEIESISPSKAKQRRLNAEGLDSFESHSNQTMMAADSRTGESNLGANAHKETFSSQTTASSWASTWSNQASAFPEETSYHYDNYYVTASQPQIANEARYDSKYDQYAEETLPEGDFSNDYSVSNGWAFVDSYGRMSFEGEFVPYLDWQLKFRLGAFFPAQKVFRSLYGNVVPIYEGEAAKFLNGDFQGWVNFSWLSKRGEASAISGKTHIKMANLGIGLNWTYFWKPELLGYVGVGPMLSRIYIKNHTFCGNTIEYKYAVGCLVKSGLQYAFHEHFFAEVFADYLYLPVNYEQKRNLGGIKVGAGLGMNF